MSRLHIAIKRLYPVSRIPTRAHPTDAAYDLYTMDPVTIDAGAQSVIDTGIALAIPPGYYGHIVDRSGLASRRLHVTGGVIDAGYRGSIRVLLWNHSLVGVHFDAGDRVAQLLIKRCEEVDFVEVTELDETDRGAAGFGSTDVSLAKLVADKERLDWLDSYRNEHDVVYEEGDPDVGLFPMWQIWRPARGGNKPKMVAFESTLRAAIDAARQPDQP